MGAEDQNDPRYWKTRYYDGVDELDRRERHWADVEACLYSGLGRLSIAMYRDDPAIDKPIDKLREALRVKVPADRIDALIDRVEQAAARLPPPADASAVARETCARLVDELAVPGSLGRKARRARDRLASAKTPAGEAVAITRDLVAAVAARGASAGPAPGLLGRLLPGSPGHATAQRDRSPGAVIGALADSLGLPREHDARVRAAVDRAGDGDADVERLLADIAGEIRAALEPGEAEAAAAPMPLHEVLRRLLGAMALPVEYHARVEAVEAGLESPLEPDAVPAAIAGIASLVHDLVAEVRAERERMEAFLAELGEQLAGIDGHLAETRATCDAMDEDGRTLRRDVAAEVDGLDADITGAHSLAHLQERVRARVDTLTGHVDTFLAEEDRRLRAARAQIEELDGTVRELTRESEALRERVVAERERADRDGLTEVWNRAAFDRRIDEEYRRWRRYGGPVSIAFWDIDRFKEINDTWGHQAGDKVLQAVARMLRFHVRETDYLARYGGEEFVLLMPGIGGESAHEASDKLRRQIEGTPFRYRGLPVPVTISCGIATLREGDALADLVRRADEALYAAKEAGRNRCMREAA